MVTAADLASGSVTDSVANGGGRIMGVETSVHNELAEVGRFSESDRVLVRRTWVDGSEERTWKLSLRIHFRLWG